MHNPDYSVSLALTVAPLVPGPRPYLFGELRWDRYAWWVDGTPVASAYHSQWLGTHFTGNRVGGGRRAPRPPTPPDVPFGIRRFIDDPEGSRNARLG